MSRITTWTTGWGLLVFAGLKPRKELGWIPAKPFLLFPEEGFHHGLGGEPRPKLGCADAWLGTLPREHIFLGLGGFFFQVSKLRVQVLGNGIGFSELKNFGPNQELRVLVRGMASLHR